MFEWRRFLVMTLCAAVVCAGALLHADAGMEVLHGAHVMLPKGKAGPSGRGNNQLVYHGGSNGIGVMTGTTTVVLVYWGSQWVGNDPSGEAAIQQSFFTAVGNTKWNNSVTQYCQGVPAGTVNCGVAGTPAGNNVITVRVWQDYAASAPKNPSQSQLAAEAVRAAGVLGYTTADANTHVQYVINTATGNNAAGFGSSYCAYHSSTTSSYGRIAYTNMPYMTDAGASCGANFNGLGPNAGITIVGGHEFAETETDIFPSVGWVDRQGAENADKCVWISSGQGAIAGVTMTDGVSYPVQSLWSNATSSCVRSYP